MEFYLIVKLIHILSSTVLFGAGLGTAFYMWRSDRSKDVEQIAHTAKNVVLADWVFTTPAVIVQPLTGFLLIYLAGYPLDSTWIYWSLVLYIAVGCLWIPVVFIQIKVRNHAEAAIRKFCHFEEAYHRKLMRWWYGLGWPAFIFVLVIFYLMVSKLQ